MRRSGLVAAVAVVMLQFIAAPAQASSFTFNAITNTYSYQGDPFNFCGYGCPEHAPVDPRGVDYIIASLTFADPLAPNLTFADPVPVPTAWTMTDHLGDFFLSGIGLPIGEDGAPGLLLSTNGTGDIVNYVMAASAGFLNSEGDFVGTSAVIVNPPVFCGADCQDLGLTDFVGVRIRSNPDTEWDAGTLVPAAIPEPGTLMLTGLGLAGIVVRYRRRRSRSGS